MFARAAAFWSNKHKSGGLMPSVFSCSTLWQTGGLLAKSSNPTVLKKCGESYSPLAVMPTALPTSSRQINKEIIRITMLMMFQKGLTATHGTSIPNITPASAMPQQSNKPMRNNGTTCQNPACCKRYLTPIVTSMNSSTKKTKLPRVSPMIDCRTALLVSLATARVPCTTGCTRISGFETTATAAVPTATAPLLRQMVFATSSHVF